jgi:hypothetical protein
MSDVLKCLLLPKSYCILAIEAGMKAGIGSMTLLAAVYVRSSLSFFSPFLAEGREGFHRKVFCIPIEALSPNCFNLKGDLHEKKLPYRREFVGR